MIDLGIDYWLVDTSVKLNRKLNGGFKGGRSNRNKLIGGSNLSVKRICELKSYCDSVIVFCVLLLDYI